MSTDTRATTTRSYCTACRKTRTHRDHTCLTCGYHSEPWPRGAGVEPADRSGDPWA